MGMRGILITTSSPGAKLRTLLYFAFLGTLHICFNHSTSVSLALQHYRNAFEDFFLTTSHSINCDLVFPICKQARAKTYTIEDIKTAFKATRIVPLNPRAVLSQLSEPTAKSRSQSNSIMCIPEKTPYTKHDLRHQTRLLSSSLEQRHRGQCVSGFYVLLMLPSIPLPKPILLVQSYSSNRSKTSVLRRTCDSSAKPSSME